VDAQHRAPLTLAEAAARAMPISHVDIELKLLMEAIYATYSHDFREYSGASQKRRVMYALQKLDCETVSMLQSKVLHDPTMFERLLEILTIPFSEMFRDPTYFLALREHVVPVLKTYPSLSIWIAGCSTGEEVYSMAILLKEEGLLDRTVLYATDINPVSLEKARQGIYPIDGLKLFTGNYQASGGQAAFSDYYTAAYNAVKFDRSLVRNVTFADHSLATDSVFSEVQLVCCRNVLIYFKPSLQDRALGLFHDSLCHRGFLALGTKESIDFSAYAGKFESVVRQERIYRKG
jgi:chemotaxis protein methyltransferase CheR